MCDYHYTGEVTSQVNFSWNTHTSPWSSLCQLSNTRWLTFGYCKSYWPLSYESWLLVQPCPCLAEVIMDKSLKFSAKWQYLFYESKIRLGILETRILVALQTYEYDHIHIYFSFQIQSLQLPWLLPIWHGLCPPPCPGHSPLHIF